ncbi:MAG TPA: hypothetical protein VMS98_15015, partial [Thermoanaerobaculia bacterium]|nr:hypothetical protein [Thermoanaerobaculia bacterium]
MRALASFTFAIAASAAGAGFEIAPPDRASTAFGIFPSVASSGDGFFVAWRDRIDEGAAIAIDSTGAPTSALPFPLFTGSYLGSVVPFGSNYLFVTRDASGDTFLSEVNAAGAVVRTFRAGVPPNNGLIATATPDASRILLTDGIRIFVVDGNGRAVGQTAFTGEIRGLR